MEPGVARTDHQRFPACAARVYCQAGECADAAACADRGGVSLAQDDAADCAGAMVAVAAASAEIHRRRANSYRGESRAGVAIAQSLWSAAAGACCGGECAGWI